MGASIPRAKNGVISRNLNTRMHTDVGRHLLLSGWWPEGISHRLPKIGKIRSTNSAVCEPCGNTLLIRNGSKRLSESPIRIAESGTLSSAHYWELGRGGCDQMTSAKDPINGTWTESRLSSVRELARETETLSDNEKGILSRSLDDLVRETPNTPVAILRFKQFVAKVGSLPLMH
jgi:hypothetical protein